MQVLLVGHVMFLKHSDKQLKFWIIKHLQWSDLQLHCLNEKERNILDLYISSVISFMLSERRGAEDSTLSSSLV